MDVLRVVHASGQGDIVKTAAAEGGPFESEDVGGTAVLETEAIGGQRAAAPPPSAARPSATSAATQGDSLLASHGRRGLSGAHVAAHQHDGAAGDIESATMVAVVVNGHFSTPHYHGASADVNARAVAVHAVVAARIRP